GTYLHNPEALAVSSHDISVSPDLSGITRQFVQDTVWVTQ
ncbi:unnamed protein product, partial [marine sediment metagenome]